MAGWNDNGRGSYGGGGYNNNRSGYSNSYNGNRSSSGSYNSRGSYGQQKELPPEITPKKVPEDYVDEAERIMRSLMSGGKTVTTSKIRNLLSLVTDIYNEENIRTDEKLRPESVVKLNLMRVRVAYECGRDDTVKSFVAQTNLLEYLKGISTDRADLTTWKRWSLSTATLAARRGNHMYGKILIRCDLEVRTGMHIGGSSAFSAIGAVDSPVVRDPYTGYPIVPGSSLKGKLRTLLARSTCQDIEHMPAFDKDDERILRLFGSSEPVRRSRLQFADAFLSNAKELSNVGVTEVKTENAISRANSVANPRQIERVIAGAKFGVSIVYDVIDPAQVEEDLSLLAKGMKLLQMDYLGGHGSRGSGRVSLKNFALEGYGAQADLSHLKSLFDEVDSYELFSV